MTGSQGDAIVIGAGFAGIAAATRLAMLGRTVTVFEKNDGPGGRAREFEMDGFRFDMGPSWYWMPDVFDEYFRDAGSSIEKHLDLVRLDPSYRTWFADGPIDIPAGVEKVARLFESMEPGAGDRFTSFMEEAGKKYDLGMGRFVRQPGHSFMELLDVSVLPEVLRLSMFSSLAKHVRKNFLDPRIVSILEFPVLFLGGRAETIPAMYSLMNYADTALGTWYPMGGMHEVVKAMVRVAEGLGVRFEYESPVERILEVGGRAAGALVAGDAIVGSTVIAAADYHHVEQNLLDAKWRRYDESYWDARVMSPSSVLFYLGLDQRVEELEHHNLFFDVPFEPHAKAIYDNPAWPDNPLFYVCAPSRTDTSVAPPGCENLFVLVPLAVGLEHDEAARQRQFDLVMNRLEKHIGRDLRPHIVTRRDYAHRDFESDYNSFKGNAYGLANTLGQTAFLKPKMKSCLPGLFYAGQLTTPGPGVPPSLLSGQMAATEADVWLSGLAKEVR